ncbi:MAG: carbohydrate binding domain-containing protein [candidate division KSB1 bacterium]|nr:carbohydrate binding domain-containing protein [candidate division KSB1 bacterium]
MNRWVMLIVFCLGLFLSLPLQAELKVAITSPKNGEVLAPCGDVKITFDVDFTGESFKDLRVYVNGMYRGVVRKEPWEFLWKKAVRGAYVLQAQLRTTDNKEAWSDPVRIKIGPVSAAEKAQNGSFECSTMAPWNLNVNSGSGASARATVIDEAYFDDPNYLMVEITSGGSYNWHVQLQQNIPVDSGHVYLISFMADADVKKTINISMQENQDPWAVQWAMDIDIEGANLYGPYEFEAVRTDPSNHIRFNIGANTTTFYIDDIRVIDTSASGVKAKEYDFTGTVKEFELLAAYPNPFNMQTLIPFRLSQAADIDLAVYNLRGERIKTLAQGRWEAGQHQIGWNGLDETQQVVSAGVYFYRLIVNDKRPYELSRKLVLVK